MGQEQSVPAPKRTANRLSKPRTNNSTANLLSRSNLYLDKKEQHFQNASTANIQYMSEPEAARDRAKAEKQQKQSKRRSLFRSKSSQDKELVTVDIHAERDFAGPQHAERPIPSHRYSTQAWSRKNSITEEAALEPNHASQQENPRPANRARMSLQHVPYAQHHSQLSLVTELPATQPQHVQSRRPSLNQETVNAQIPNPLPTRRNSEIETDTYGPIRRRSLLQHGVATRPVFSNNDPRQSLPSQARPKEDLQNYYYNPSKPTSSPLSNLAGLRYADEPGPRVETPDEADYGHIGAFKLGTLRITNGVASPSPSIERAATMGAGDDYISVGHNTRVISDLRHRRGISNRSNTFTSPADMVKTQWRSERAESPLRRQTTEDDDDDNYKPFSIDIALPPLDPSLALFDFDTTKDLFKGPESATKSQELANEYIQDIALSPFSFGPSRPNSPVLEATSKHTAIEDELFDAEPSTPTLTHSDSGYAGSAGQRSVRGPREKPLTKADSGYSSNVSLRSFRTNTSNAAPVVPAKEAPPTPPKEQVSRVASGAYSFKSSTTEKTVRSRHSLPALPREDQPALNHAYDRAPPVPLKHSNVYSSGKDIPAPKIPTKSPEQVYAAAQNRPHVVVHPQRTRKSSLTIESNLDGHQTSSSSTSSSSSNRLSTRKDRRPHSLQPQPIAHEPIYTVQADREHIAAPPVSYEALQHLKDRVGAFPVNSFPNTWSGLRRTSSKETLGTIFSVGSGYTDVPLTTGRLQSALPKPPPPERKPVSTYNSYQPPISPPKRLQKKSFTYDRSPVAASFEETLKVSKRRSFTPSQPETDARQSVTSRNVSAESWTSAVTESTVVGVRRSFDSIARGNPFASRSSSSEYQDQTHVTQASSTQSLRNQYLSTEQNHDERRLSLLGRDRKTKSPPPVSMQTQRKVTPTPHAAFNSVTTSQARPVSILTTHHHSYESEPEDFPPSPPQHSPLPPPQQSRWAPDSGSHEQWTEPQNFWAQRRKSAGEALQVNNRSSSSTLRSRKSMEPRRPPCSHQNAQLKMQKSLEVVRARKMIDHQLSSSPVHQLFPPLQGSHSSPRIGATRDQDFQTRQQAKFDRNGEYNHTYGYPSPNKENRVPSPEKEYYESEERWDQDHHIQQNLHQSQNSTSDMLILDRFTGGLNYGYEPGYGIVGSAGTRNVGNSALAAGGRKSVEASRMWGVDLSDVPVIIHRVQG